MTMSLLSGAGHRLPGGIPTGPEPDVEAKTYEVGARPLKISGMELKPGTPIPSELIARIPRLESWVRARRIVAA